MTPFFASLPESVWAEVNRRLRAEPAAWELADNTEVVAAWVRRGSDLNQWRPGPLGLTALGVFVPEAAANPVPWLNTAGRALLAQAYDQLSATSHPEPAPWPGAQWSLVRAAVAAVALRQRLHADSSTLPRAAAEAAAAPDRWALPLLCLYGLMDDPAPLVAALLAASRESGRLVEIVARMWAANESSATVASLAPAALKEAALSAPFLRIAAGVLARQGMEEAAHAISDLCNSDAATSKNAKSVESTPDVGQRLAALAAEVEVHRLARLGRKTAAAAARLGMGHAVEAAEGITAELALQLGHWALADGDPVTALAAFEQAQAHRPRENVGPFIARAKLAIGDTDAAVSTLGYGKLAGSRRARLAAAHVYHRAGNLDLARAAALSASASDDPNDLLQTADLLAQLGEPLAAAQTLQWLIGEHPANAQAHAALAQLALAHSEVPFSAAESAWQAVGLMPADAAARETLAEALGRTDPAAALDHWRRAIGLRADAAAHPRLRLAETALACRPAQPQLALATSKALLDDSRAGLSTEQRAQVLCLAGQALTQLNQPDEAFQYFNQATALNPASALPWRVVAAHHRAQGDLPRALAALEAGRHLVGEAAPDAADIYAELADLHAQLQQPHEAIANFEKAAALAPDRPQLHRRLGELYHAQGKLPQAIESLRAAATATGDPTTWHLLGRALEAANKLPDALASFQRAQSAGDASRELFRDLGRLAYQLGETAVARAALQTVCNDPAADIESLVLLGAICEQARNFSLALDIYKRAVALTPRRADLCVRMGLCCLELGHPEAAIAAMREAAERDLDDLPLQQAMAQAYAAAHLWVESHMAYEQAARLAPDNHPLLAALSQSARRAGNTPRAVEALRQAIALADDTAEGVAYRQALAGLFAADGQLQAAKTVYLEAHALAPGHGPVLMGLGQVHAMLNELPQAEAAFDKATRALADKAAPHFALGEARSLLGHWEPARAAFARAAELEPANPLHLRRAGECLWQQGKKATAIALWQKNLVAHPKDGPTHARLGVALSGQGRHTESLLAFEHAVAVSPTDAEHRGLLVEAARAAYALGDYPRAAAHVGRVTQLTPNDADAWQLLGEAYRAQGQHDKALPALQKAAQLSPTEGWPHAVLAHTLARQKRLPDALVSAEIALRNNPDDPNVLAAVADVFVQAGRFAEARQACQRVATAQPDDPTAQLALARALVLEFESRHRPTTDKSPDEQRELLHRALERAAALGADAAAVREWSGRSQALFGDPAQAASLLESAALTRPSPDLYRHLAACYRRIGKHAPARHAIQSALEGEPATVANLVELGQICLAQDDKGGARSAFERATALDPRHAQAHQLLAETLLATGDRANAVELYHRALALDPAQAAWHHRLAELYEGHREPASALVHYQRAVALAAEHGLPAADAANYSAALARAYARDNDYPAARREFEAALALRGDMPAWWTHCGEICMNLDDAAAALECFVRACELMPTDTAALIGAARAALALGNENEAAEKAESVLRFDPDNAAALIAMAEVYTHRGDHAKAAAAYARAASGITEPQSLRPVLQAQSKLHRAARQHGSALTALKRLIEMDPDDDETLGMLGETLADAGFPDDALRAFQRASAIAPRKTIHLLRLGWLCRANGQLDAALGYLQNARDLEEQNPEVLRQMGLVFEDRRQYDRAHHIYETLLALEPHNAENFFRAGIALKNLRDYAEAARLFRRASELEPGHVEAERQRLAVSALGLLSARSS